MKVLSTEGLTKLIQLIKGTFIPNTDTVSATTVTLADVATTGTLDSLSNVTITSATSGQALVYDGSKWVNGAGGGGSSTLSGLVDVTITSATSGQALLYDGSKWVNGSAGVSATYDAVNERITFA